MMPINLAYHWREAATVVLNGPKKGPAETREDGAKTRSIAFVNRLVGHSD